MTEKHRKRRLVLNNRERYEIGEKNIWIRLSLNMNTFAYFASFAVVFAASPSVVEHLDDSTLHCLPKRLVSTALNRPPQ